MFSENEEIEMVHELEELIIDLYVQLVQRKITIEEHTAGILRLKQIYGQKVYSNALQSANEILSRMK